jgi:hypothetical protein
MKVRDKRFDALRSTKQVEQVETGKAGEVKETSAAQLVENQAGSKAAKAALKALALDGDSDTAQARTRAGEMGVMGAELMGAPKKKGKSKGQKAAAIAALTISLLGVTQGVAKADVVFLDFNNGVKEIETARKMAQGQGEDFHLVRPTTEALEQTFARAEAGEIDLSTLVLSGHSLGDSVWGSGPGGESHRASMNDFKELKEKYPKAFAQVKHVFFMACYAGGKAHSANWNKVFHNARAIVGFYGSGPASHRPASSWTLKNVEAALDALPDATLSPQQALLKAKQISRLKGPAQTKFGIRLDGVHHQHGAKSTSADAALEQVQFARNQSFTPYFDATAGHEMTPSNHQVSPLRDYYNQVQSALNSVDPDSTEAAQLNKDIKTTIRLIYFDNIQKNVEHEHRGDFNAANAQLTQLGEDVQIPKDLKQMNRAETIALSEALKNVEDPTERLVVLEQGEATATIANAWLESIGSELRLDFTGVEGERDANNRMNQVERLIDLRTFDQDDLDEITELKTEVDAVKGMSGEEKKAHIEGKLNEKLEQMREQVTSVLEDEQSSLELPADGTLTRESARELATELKDEAEALDNWETWSMTQLAAHLETWAGDAADTNETVIMRELVRDNNYDLSSVDESMEALGKTGLPGLEEGEAVPSAVQLSDALGHAHKHATEANAAPADVVAALEGLEKAMDEAEPSVIEQVQTIFNDGLVQLTEDAIPDNWITD